MRSNSVKPIHGIIRLKYRNNPQRERPKVVFPAFPTPISAVPAAGGCPTCTQIQARPQVQSLSAQASSSCKAFKESFGHGSAALTKIHQLWGAGSNGPAPWRHSKMQKTRSHIESLFEVRNSSCIAQISEARTLLFSEDSRQCPNKLEKPRGKIGGLQKLKSKFSPEG